MNFKERWEYADDLFNEAVSDVYIYFIPARHLPLFYYEVMKLSFKLSVFVFFNKKYKGIGDI